MTVTIAVAGKGGTGKTTFIALLIKWLREQNAGTILAIDGDPSANLHWALGMPMYETIGHIREETTTLVSSGTYNASIPKVDYLEYRINESLVEGNGIDLIAMGRPEGPGCYCAANNILRMVIDRLGNHYDYVVIDNEAGMEHISRQTTRYVDVLFILTDVTMRGLMAAEEILKMQKELDTRFGRVYLVLNRADGPLPAVLANKIKELGVELIGTLPNDPTVGEFDAIGRPLIEMPEDVPIVRAVGEIGRKTGVTIGLAPK